MSNISYHWFKISSAWVATLFKLLDVHVLNGLHDLSTVISVLIRRLSDNTSFVADDFFDKSSLVAFSGIAFLFRIVGIIIPSLLVFREPWLIELAKPNEKITHFIYYENGYFIRFNNPTLLSYNNTEGYLFSDVFHIFYFVV